MDMLVKLYELPNPQIAYERLQQAGIIMRRALAPEKHKVTAWVRKNFSEAWASEAEVAFSRQPVSCFIAIHHGKIVGFACHDATCPNFFGPTGVEPGARKSGIWGSAIVRLSRSDEAAGFWLRHHRRRWARGVLFENRRRSCHRRFRARHLSRPAIERFQAKWDRSRQKIQSQRLVIRDGRAADPSHRAAASDRSIPRPRAASAAASLRSPVPASAGNA